MTDRTYDRIATIVFAVIAITVVLVILGVIASFVV